MIIKSQLKIGDEKTHNTLFFSFILWTMNIPKVYISSSEIRYLPFFIREWKRTNERDESKNNEFVSNFIFFS